MKYLLTVFLLYTLQILSAQRVHVSVFNSLPVVGLAITVNEGVYNICSDNQTVCEIQGGQVVYISMFNNKLLVNNAQGCVGSYDSLQIDGTTDGELRVTPIEPKAASRTFPDNILLRIDYNRIMIINDADIEHYIAGVVEAETGTKAEPEFQKAQALLCRTYVYSHLNRHESEGFNLCDDVHCQAYHGQTTFSRSIYNFTILTRDSVIVAPDSTLITASFHGNCGGETESSGNTWLKGADYLVPVKDPYCKLKLNANWAKIITLEEWKKYLKSQGFSTNALNSGSLEMKKTGRQQYYRIGTNSILCRQIRADLNLKSSFFQVIVKSSSVTFKGHGYGHGVGMCQDGAMKMASIGFRYRDIINFYFKGVKIVRTEARIINKSAFGQAIEKTLSDSIL